jgi:hypothetical protein
MVGAPIAGRLLDMTRFASLLALTAPLALATGCGGDGGGNASCVPGIASACTCSSGRGGAQVCDAEGRGFGPCQCEGAPAHVPSDGGVDRTGADGCVPACGGRECGPDPACGASCGACASGACGAEGRCESADGAPRILSWALSGDVVTPTRSLMISVVLTDPDGIDDLVGGTLLDTEGRSYGTFATDAAEGSYSLALAWADIDGRAPITATSGRRGARSLVASFFDVAGNVTAREFDISLECDEAGQTPCDGRCFDLQSDVAACGSCGRACEETSFCERGDCWFLEWSDDRATCADVCAGAGAECLPPPTETEERASYAGYLCTDVDVDCDVLPPASTVLELSYGESCPSFSEGEPVPFSAMRCWCAER